eukprot:UN26155
MKYFQQDNVIVLFGDTDLDNGRKRGILRLYSDVGLRKIISRFERFGKTFGIITSWKENLEPKIEEYRQYLGGVHQDLIRKVLEGKEVIIPAPLKKDLTENRDAFFRDGEQLIFHTIGLDDNLDFNFRYAIQKMLDLVDEEIIGIQNGAISNARKKRRLDDDIKNNRRRTNITLENLPSRKFCHTSEEGKIKGKQMKAITK